MMKIIRNALALITMIATILVVTAVPAQAATAITYAATRITGIPAAGGSTARLIGSIQLSMTAGQTAYVYSSMNAYDATQVTLVDNEVLCSGAGTGNVVMGENIDPDGSPNPGRDNITIITRFLVSATSSGTVGCDLYYRGNSLSPSTSALTVKGEFRFADFSVGESASGLAMQESLPNGNLNVTSTSTRYTPILDTTLTSAQTQVDVIADMEYMSCAIKGDCPNSTDISSAKFTLVVEQMNGDTICKTAPQAQTVISINRQTHHKAVPLYTHLDLTPGCRRLYAYVRTEYVSGHVGAIQGMSVNLPDADGSGTHDSVMTHMFALPT